MTTTIAPSPEHVRAWRADYESDVRSVIKPKPRLSLSQWAGAFRQLAGGSAEKGLWQNARVPYLVEPMDALTDPAVERIVIMKPARVGATEALPVNGTLYYMHQDPSPVLIALPTLDDAEKWSKTKLVPAIEATEVTREILPHLRGRDGTNTILYKEYPGGNIQIVGTNSPRMLRMRDARVVFLDEVDAMPRSSGDEGDTVKLLEKRADNWPNRKICMLSSPKWKGTSRIEAAYANSDRRRYWMPCPQCGEYQVLQFGGRDTPYGLKWAKRKPESVFYLCEHHGCTIEERRKLAMHLEGARWRPDVPGHPTRGYRWNALISLFPGVRWPRIVQEWQDAQLDPETLQVFVNTVLAETYEEQGEKVEGTSLFDRREVYPAEVPKEVGVLTAFVDVQRGSGGWLEVLVRGWGKDQESWRILHERIEGSIEDTDVHEQLDAILLRPYQHESGGTLRIRRTLIDSGDQAAAVYQYVKPRQAKGVFASKGDKGVPNAPIVVRAKKPNDAGVKLMTIGTFTAKRRMFFRLKLARPGVPGYMHFHRLPDSEDPERRPEIARFDAQDREYFKQFGAEKLRRDKDAKGQEVLSYVQIEERNEATDLEVGALAALYSLGPSVYDRLAKIVAVVQARGARAGTEPAAPDDTEREAPDEPPPRRPPPRKRGGFMSGWRRW